jgi:hypothetical protein
VTDLEQALEGPLELLGDLVLVVGVAASILVLGAKLERHLMKRQLEVLDGDVDLDLTEVGSGDRR